MKWIPFILLLLIGCKPHERIVNVCEPDTVRIYIAKVDTTFFQFGRTYIRAYERAIELERSERSLLENAPIGDSLRQAMQANALNQRKNYHLRLAREVWQYFTKIVLQTGQGGKQ